MTRRNCLALVWPLVAIGGLVTVTGAQEASVPLRQGLTIVTAVNWPESGDYESLKRLTDVGDRAVTIGISSDAPVGQGNPLAGLLGGGPPAVSAKPEHRQFNVRRTVRREDLQDAHEYMQSFSEDAPETFPGTTALGVSAAVLNELKSRGESQLTIFDRRGAGGALGGLLGGLLGGQAAKELSDNSKLKGTLHRVKGGRSTLTIPVNGTPTPLPVLQARGALGDLETEFFFLDDPANPLALKFSYGDNHVEVIRIDFPLSQGSDAPVRIIEKQLASTGRAEVHGIYFDFASDRIKEESGPVLTEIAQALADNPAWKLSVEGHTDNIGGDPSNVDLSKRRAAAVRQALVGEHKVAATRLTTDGFGAGKPKDTNATLAGRARNRRVELIRQP